MDEEKKHIDTDDFFEHHRITVDAGQSLLRIDKFLASKLANTSRSRIQAAVENDCIHVNGKPVKSNYKVKPNEIISVLLPEPPRDKEILAENIPLNIVFEDDFLLVVNKPAGMVVHPAYGNFTGTLVNALYFHLKINDQTEGVVRAGLVHRIDKDTSGLLVIAKDESSMTFLAKQFFDHSIDRKYNVVVWGVPKEPEGTISSFIGRDLKDRKKMHSYKDSEKGKEAITHYKLIEDFGYCSLLECELETGRTHQIRVHLSSIGHPVFGDSTYGGDSLRVGPSFSKYRQFIDNALNIINRQALHAKSLGFIHPKTHNKVFFDSEIPPDMRELVQKWRNFSGSNNSNE